MELLPLITIPGIYLLAAYTKPYIKEKTSLNICAICIAVSTSWLILFTLWILKFELASSSIGILMGMSIVGIMYKLEDFYKKKKIQNFWFVRLVIVIGGFYMAEQLLNKSWSLFTIIIIGSIIITVIASIFFQKTTANEIIEKHRKKLDDCC